MTTTTTATEAAPPGDAATAPAEDRVADLQVQLDRTRAELAAAKDEAARAERARQLTALLAQARPVDLDAALLLAKRAIGERTDADLAQVVRDLRRQKPHLFRAGIVASGAARTDDAAADPATTAAQAARTGDRRALLDYLRARRG